MDLIDSAVMSPDEAEDMARTLGLKFYRTCVKENLNVQEVFKYLAELNDNTGSEKYALCVMNICDRKLFTEPLLNKRPATVRDALKKILARAGGRPITISSDKKTWPFMVFALLPSPFIL